MDAPYRQSQQRLINEIPPLQHQQQHQRAVGSWRNDSFTDDERIVMELRRERQRLIEQQRENLVHELNRLRQQRDNLLSLNREEMYHMFGNEPGALKQHAEMLLERENDLKARIDLACSHNVDNNIDMGIEQQQRLCASSSRFTPHVGRNSDVGGRFSRSPSPRL